MLVYGMPKQEMNFIDLRFGVAYEPSVQFSPDGKKLATEYGLWDLESEAKLASFDSHTSHVRSVDFSPGQCPGYYRIVG